MTEIPVDIPGAGYRICIAEGLLACLGRLLPPPGDGQSAAVVADHTTAGLFGPPVHDSLAAAGWRPAAVSVAPGEASKTLDTAATLYADFARLGLDRLSTVFALGGGVVGDLAGFVAATYLRGLPFVPLPTTLLAQVDSSVGGKVAVDLPQAKNLVGAFHQPSAVVIDPLALRSLPSRELSAGFAEVVKHAAIADAALFALLEDEAPRLLALDMDLLARVVARNCAIKAAVVVQDPQERTGRRAVLNYGHSIGHALERAATGWALLHGEAVAIGMVAEARAAARLGLAGPHVADRLMGLLARLGLPTCLDPGRVDTESAEAALKSDKKVVRGRIALPVVPEIGAVEITEDLSLADLAAALREALAGR